MKIWMNIQRFMYDFLLDCIQVIIMRILLYNQSKYELKKMSDDVIEALHSELVMLDVCYSFLRDKKKINHVVYDMAIVDLSHGNEDALFLCRHLRYKNKDCMIILLGDDYKESTFAFEVKASYFILKEDCDLKKMIINQIEVYKKRNPWVYFIKENKKYKVYLKDVIYMETTSDLIHLVCFHQIYTMIKKENLNIIDFMIKHGLIRIHQSYYICSHKILGFKKGEVIMRNGDCLSVSLKYRDGFKEVIRGL